MFEGLFGGRARSVERRLKTLHARQSKIRERLAEAQEKGRKDKIAALQAEREAVNREVAELTAEHRKLKAA